MKTKIDHLKHRLKNQTYSIFECPLSIYVPMNTTLALRYLSFSDIIITIITSKAHVLYKIHRYTSSNSFEKGIHISTHIHCHVPIFAAKEVNVPKITKPMTAGVAPICIVFVFFCFRQKTKKNLSLSSFSYCHPYVLNCDLNNIFLINYMNKTWNCLMFD